MTRKVLKEEEVVFICDFCKKKEIYDRKEISLFLDVRNMVFKQIFINFIC